MNTDNEHIDPVGLLPKIFAGEATPAETEEVEVWLSASPENRVEYDAVFKLWNLTGSTVPGEIDIDHEWQKMERAIMPHGRTITMVRILQIAASVILISALAFAGLKFTGSISRRAPAQELSALTLPDGTRLFLNAGSKVTYKKGFGLSHRELVLKGEGYFEVEKNISLPFLISSGNAVIRVTGTKFNVRAYHNLDHIKVMVTEGHVSLYDADKPGDELSLAAGETGFYDKRNHLVSKQITANMNDMAWKTGIMDFQNTPLSEVTDVLANTYHRRIEISPPLGRCSVTVRFENQELDAILAVLKSTLGLELTVKGKRIFISGKGC